MFGLSSGVNSGVNTWMTMLLRFSNGSPATLCGTNLDSRRQGQHWEGEEAGGISISTRVQLRKAIRCLSL
eukprot:277708-Amphidinium_carterae.1